MISAVLANPDVYETLPATKRAKIIPKLVSRGFRYQGEPLSAEANKIKSNAESGLRALDTLEKEISGFGGKAQLAASAVPGAPFARTLKAASGEVQDVITRLRTGAALNEEEQRFYMRQLPSILDLSDPGTIEYKMGLFRNLFQSLATLERKGRATVGPEGAGPAPQSQIQAPTKDPLKLFQ